MLCNRQVSYEHAFYAVFKPQRRYLLYTGMPCALCCTPRTADLSVVEAGRQQIRGSEFSMLWRGSVAALSQSSGFKCISFPPC